MPTPSILKTFAAAFRAARDAERLISSNNQSLADKGLTRDEIGTHIHQTYFPDPDPTAKACKTSAGLSTLLPDGGWLPKEPVAAASRR